MKKLTHQLIFLALVLGCSSLASVQAADGSIQFSGGLYAPPCDVRLDTQAAHEQPLAQVVFARCETPVRASLSALGTPDGSAKVRVIHSQAEVSLPVAGQRGMIVTVEYI